MGNSTSKSTSEAVKSLQNDFPSVDVGLIGQIVDEYSKPQYAREDHSCVEYAQPGRPPVATFIALAIHQASVTRQGERDRAEEDLQAPEKVARALNRVRVKLRELVASQALGSNARMQAVCEVVPLCPRKAIRNELVSCGDSAPLDWVAENLLIKMCPTLLDAARDQAVLVSHHQRTMSWWQRLFTPANRCRILPLPPEHRFCELSPADMFRDDQYIAEVERLLQAQFESRRAIKAAMSEHNNDYTRCTESLSRSNSARKAGFQLARSIQSGKLSHPDLMQEIALLESRADASRSQRALECQCCFTDSTQVVRCDGAEPHVLCATCVTAYIDSSANQLSTGVVRCFSSDGCGGILPRAALALALETRSLDAIDDAVTKANLPAPSLQHLQISLCPFCGGQAEPVESHAHTRERQCTALLFLLSACFLPSVSFWPWGLLALAAYGAALAHSARGKALILQREPTLPPHVIAGVAGVALFEFNVLLFCGLSAVLAVELAHLGLALLSDARVAGGGAGGGAQRKWARCVRPRSEGGCGVFSCAACHEPGLSPALSQADAGTRQQMRVRAGTGTDAAAGCGEGAGHEGECYSAVPAEDSEAALQGFLAETLTLASVRACPRCGVEIQKAEGCNKVTCSQCGGKLCYECGRAILGYDHFCQHPTVPGLGCSECDKCRLFSSYFGVSEAAQAEAIQEALRLYRARFPASLPAAPGRVISVSGLRIQL